MATLYIEEYQDVGKDEDGNIMPIPGALVTNQKVTIAGTSAQSAAFNSRTKYLTILTDTACQFVTGSNPTASATSLFCPANFSRSFQLKDGHTKIAVISQV